MISERLDTQMEWHRRISNLEKGEYPLLMRNGPKLCMYILPTLREIERSPFQLTEATIEMIRLIRPLYGGYWAQEIKPNEIINFSKEPNSHLCHFYVRFFENGIIENCDSFLLLETGSEKNSYDIAILKKEILATAEIQANFCFRSCVISEAIAFLSIVGENLDYLEEFHRRNPFLRCNNTSTKGLHAKGHKFLKKTNNIAGELTPSWFI